MTLIRTFSKVDKESKIKLPGNVQKAAGLKTGQLVELRIVGATRKKNVLISAKGNAK